MRAVKLGKLMFLGVFSGSPENWAQDGRACREAWTKAGYPTEAAHIVVTGAGYVGENEHEVKFTYHEHEERLFQTAFAVVG